MDYIEVVALEFSCRDCGNPCRASTQVSGLQFENLVSAEYETGELLSTPRHSETKNFVQGWFQQIQLRTENRENGDLRVVAS